MYDAGRKNRLLAILKDMLGLSPGHSTLPDEYSCSWEPIFFRQLKTVFIRGSVKVMFSRIVLRSEIRTMRDVYADVFTATYTVLYIIHLLTYL